jgi:hypothetical protein
MADGAAAPNMMHVAKADTALAAPPPSPDIKIRKEFPESWIFFSNGSEDGLVQLTKLCVTFCTV